MKLKTIGNYLQNAFPSHSAELLSLYAQEPTIHMHELTESTERSSITTALQALSPTRRVPNSVRIGHLGLSASVAMRSNVCCQRLASGGAPEYSVQRAYTCSYVGAMHDRTGLLPLAHVCCGGVRYFTELFPFISAEILCLKHFSLHYSKRNPRKFPCIDICV